MGINLNQLSKRCSRLVWTMISSLQPFPKHYPQFCQALSQRPGQQLATCFPLMILIATGKSILPEPSPDDLSLARQKWWQVGEKMFKVPQQFYFFPSQILKSDGFDLFYCQKQKNNMQIYLFLLLIGATMAEIMTSSTVSASITVDYPIRLTYVNKISDWSSAKGLAKSIGVPGYSNHSYTHVCLTFFTCQTGPLDAAILWDQPSQYFGTTTFGSTDDEIRATLLSQYHAKGIKLMVSAFGATQFPTSQGIDAAACATKIANYVIKNKLDGVDIDYEDTAAFQSGIGETWLITLTKTLRNKLPNAIITHAPQAPYFGGVFLYPQQAYLKVHREIGSEIQFYNVQFYNQDTSPYNTATTLFNVSGGWANGTSVNQIIAAGIPKEKIVVGKPATTADANPGSYMSPADLSAAIVAAYKYNQWKTGVMFWQFSSDPSSSIVDTAIGGLLKLLNSSSSNQLTYPIKFTCLNIILSQKSDFQTLHSMGIPQGDSYHGYNYISVYSWTYRAGAQGPLLFWVNPSSFLTTTYKAGKTNDQLRSEFKAMVAQKGIKLLVNAFSSYENPTTELTDSAETVAIRLAQFVTAYGFDGVDIDYRDSRAFLTGTGETWLQNFTIKLRQLLPNLLIVHSVSAGYFTDQSVFPKGAYLTVHGSIGQMIDFYVIRYYGQGSSTYNTASSLFNASTGWAVRTSVNELIAKGVSANKLVIGKTVTRADADPYAFMNADALATAVEQQYSSTGWKTGVMLYQLSSDVDGTTMKTVLRSFL